MNIYYQRVVLIWNKIKLLHFEILRLLRTKTIGAVLVYITAKVITSCQPPAMQLSRYYRLLLPFCPYKPCFPNNTRKLKCEFNLTGEVLKKAFSLPHSVAFEPYVKAFQFKVLNPKLNMNSKLHKIGYIADDLCTFCKRESETRQHLFYHCSERYILIGLLTPELPLLNYL